MVAETNAAAPNLDGPPPESLLLELYDSSLGLPPLVPGTFRLGEGVNDNLGTFQNERLVQCYTQVFVLHVLQLLIDHERTTDQKYRRDELKYHQTFAQVVASRTAN